ncbi:type VI secretion system protein TssR domain-containing protein [Bacteroides sp. 224]|uniref:type VI secretion system protein TssR domain-containing protein n=1 Tax=Bacteroides sp. 224 TaxID=2302936 RepID=UPI0013D47342|nr:type VI secretion system protein TssR domain-containing protein [Bacteroides sp. 224]NDV65222.1 hypothetical protein [Bacteroides sp. 224]
MKKTQITLCAAFLLLITSCGPVHRFTRVKKIPRKYSQNYCVGDIKAPYSDLNKDPWVVYSDREKNESFNKRGGKVKAKDMDYLDPFLVIGSKKDYLKLIKYTPDILKNGKLEYKKAEYYGWVPKSKLLLNSQSVTDIASGRKNKMLTVFADTVSINEPEKYVKSDSLLLYKDLELKSQVGTVSPFSVVYQLKQSEDGNMTLLARKPYIKPDEALQDILGWVDNSLIQNIGTGLHVNLSTIPQKNKRFFIRKGEEIPVTEDMTEFGELLTDQYPSIRFSPVSSYSRKDSLIAFKTRLTLPVFDYSNNYIFNVNGGQISHKEFRTIARNLKRINFSFVFEGKEYTISQFPQIVNALQNLQSLFERLDHSYTFQFNSVLTFDDATFLSHPISSGFSPDYSQMINFLSDKANNKAKLAPIAFPERNTWEGLNKALELLEDQKSATNVIVLIGEKGFSGDGIQPDLAKKLLKNNCRVIGFQVYADDGDDYNNFVLDIETMISSYADAMLKSKCDLLVSPEQIRRANYYTEVGEMQNNGYRLDFPKNSITQGALFFPQKQEVLPMEILANNIDTLLQQIGEDHSSVIQYMSKAFRTVGNNRTQFDSLFLRHHEIMPGRIPHKKLVAGFINEMPGWNVPSRIVVLEDSINHSLDYRLMLSEKELSELKEFIASLSAHEVEYIVDAKKKKEQKRKPCNCPEDDLFAELEGEQLYDAFSETPQASPDSIGKYAGTRKIRKHLRKQYLKPIQYCKLCKESKRKLKRLTLAEAQFRITGCPVSNELLNRYQVRDLKRKKRMSNEQLEELVNYYKEMKKELDKAESFDSNGETYYWVDRRMLP